MPVINLRLDLHGALSDKLHVALPGHAQPRGPIRQLRVSDREEEKQSNEQRKDAQGFRHGKAEDETAELAIRC